MPTRETQVTRNLRSADRLNQDNFILIVEEHRQLLGTAKQLRLQMQKWMDIERRDANADKSIDVWKPSDELVGLYTKLAKIVLQLVSEGRQLAKARSAGNLSDDMLDEELEEIFEEEHAKRLKAMSLKDLEACVKKRRAA